MSGRSGMIGTARRAGARPCADGGPTVGMVTVRFSVGPVDAAVARRWLDNSRAIVAAVRAHREVMPFVVEDALLDLADAYLTVWREAAGGDVFEWTSDAESENVDQLAEQWRLIASLDDETMERIGVSWAPPETNPMYEALLAGVLDALRQGGSELAADLAARPPGSVRGMKDVT